jgi:regulator of replication initiation timing
MAEICDQLGGFAQCAAAIRSLAAERDALRAENEKLRTTLNLAVTAHHEAVNTAISLVAERDTLRAALKECADDLEAEIKHRHGDWVPKYPRERLKRDQDMAPVIKARAALGEKK